ncbi:MAG: hypothetical protein ACOX5J_08570 [Candidatus Hydrogenedentales bacterium]|jgi:hypothetical protein
MRRKKANLLILLPVFLLHCVSEAEERPPSAAAIYDTLDQLWGSRKFTEVTDYVQKLKSSWGGYVPVELALATHSDKYGAQIEDSIERLTALRTRLQGEIAAASPVFMELLDATIRQQEYFRDFWIRQGFSREQRLAERDPLKMTDFTDFEDGKHWAVIDEEMMYFNAPEVFLTEQGVRVAHPLEPATPDPKLKQMDTQQLLEYLGDYENSMIKRKACAQELVRRRAEAGPVSELVESLWGWDAGYTYQYTVEELVKIGPAVIPELIAYLDKDDFYRDKEEGIWALVRIGVADPAVIQTLEAISSNANSWRDSVKYAQNALQYLQSKNK